MANAILNTLEYEGGQSGETPEDLARSQSNAIIVEFGILMYESYATACVSTYVYRST